MKKKFILTLFVGLLGLAVGVASYGEVTPLTVEAAAGEANSASEEWAWVKYGLIGDFTDPRTGTSQGWDEGDTLPFGEGYTYENETWYDITITLYEGNQFKAYSPTSEENKHWLGASGCDDPAGLNSEYFGRADGDNWVVKKSGTYVLSVKDGWENWKDSDGDAYAWRKGELAEVQPEEFTITYYNGNDVIAEDTALEGSTYTPSWKYVENHVLRGWYSDPELETQITNFVVNGDTNVYGKYEVCTEPDLVIYHEGEYTHAYGWNSDSGAEPFPWAEAQMGIPTYPYNENVHVMIFPAEYEVNRVIFHNNSGKQTPDLIIDPTKIGEDGVYAIWGQDGVKENPESGWWTEAESLDRATALEIVELWHTYIRVDGDVCWLTTTEGKTMWETIKNTISTVTEGTYNLVYNAPDIAGLTIGQTYEYLSQFIDGKGNEAGYAPFAGGMSNSDITLLVGALLLALTLIGGGIYLSYRKKKARHL